ncbi:MAG: NAD(P)H-binding protein [Kibdelosporangium sp.]
MTILVTGATGKVGRQAVAQLQAQGHDVRALVRRPSGAAAETLGDLTDVDSVRRALAGVRKVFLVWPFFDTDSLPPVLEAMADKQIVYLSAAGETPWALAAEALIEQATSAWTFLRPTGFAGNALEFAPEIKAGDVVRAPFAKLARPLIHEYDMAAVGVRALTEPGHTGKKYELSGPELVTQEQQVQIIGEVLGRPLRFEEITPEQAKAGMQAAGWPVQLTENALDAWAGMLENPEPVTSRVRLVTGEPAITFRGWALDHAAYFQG